MMPELHNESWQGQSINPRAVWANRKGRKVNHSTFKETRRGCKRRTERLQVIHFKTGGVR